MIFKIFISIMMFVIVANLVDIQDLLKEVINGRK